MLSTCPLTKKQSGQPSLSKSARAQPHLTHGIESDARPKIGGVVVEDPVAEVLIERAVLVGEIGDEQLGKPIAVDVLGIDAHPRLGHAVDVVGGARDLGDIVERPVTAVQEQEVGVHVVGDEDVDQAVVVEIGRHDAETVAVGAGLGPRTFFLVLVAGSSTSLLRS